MALFPRMLLCFKYVVGTHTQHLQDQIHLSNLSFVYVYNQMNFYFILLLHISLLPLLSLSSPCLSFFLSLALLTPRHGSISQVSRVQQEDHGD